MTENLAVSFSI